MSTTNTIARSLHDLGAAAWFGGTLMGATSANRAVGDVHDPVERSRALNGVWRRWWPVNAAAVLAHLGGGAVLTAANLGRVSAQSGARGQTGLKTLLTGAGVASALYAGYLGKRLSDADEFAAADGTTPTRNTPAELASALRQQRVLQWLQPAITGALIVSGARLGELQRPAAVAKGVLGRS